MRIIKLKIKIEWDDYNNVCDELILEDVFEGFAFKKGVTIEQIGKSKQQKKIESQLKSKV
jgi:hypothetical protein